MTFLLKFFGSLPREQSPPRKSLPFHPVVLLSLPSLVCPQAFHKFPYHLQDMGLWQKNFLQVSFTPFYLVLGSPGTWVDLMCPTSVHAAACVRWWTGRSETFRLQEGFVALLLYEDRGDHVTGNSVAFRGLERPLSDSNKTGPQSPKPHETLILLTELETRFLPSGSRRICAWLMPGFWPVRPWA